LPCPIHAGTLIWTATMPKVVKMRLQELFWWQICICKTKFGIWPCYSDKGGKFLNFPFFHGQAWLSRCSSLVTARTQFSALLHSLILVLLCCSVALLRLPRSPTPSSPQGPTHPAPSHRQSVSPTPPLDVDVGWSRLLGAICTAAVSLELNARRPAEARTPPRRRGPAPR
jgi:hypothetical protein